MHREKFPERIPFRLTRMLMSAMEVSGIEGSFRTTCEIVMNVLRGNKESLMAVLEAFVHDPLINWRLLGANVAARSLGKIFHLLHLERVDSFSAGVEQKKSKAILENDFLDDAEDQVITGPKSRKLQRNENELMDAGSSLT